MRLSTFLACLTTISLLPALAIAELQMQWSQQLPARKPAWEFTQRMPQDRAYVPAAAGEIVVVGCEHNGAVVAWDAASGEERWRFYTGSPIRVAPVLDDERVYAASDDGYLYCLDHAGKLLWKFRGGPSDRWIIGHERLMSAWPAAARPVLAGGKLIYQAGVWPVDGVYLHALDPKTGERIWSTGNLTFRPYGELRSEGNELFVYGFHGSGVFDLQTGRMTGAKPPKPAPRPERPSTPGTKGQVYYAEQAGERVIVSTSENIIYGFGAKGTQPQQHARKIVPIQGESPDVEQLLRKAGVSEGYCLLVGADDKLIAGLLTKSNLHVVAIEPDESAAGAARRKLDGAGLFDEHRLSVIVADPVKFNAPPYCASLIVLKDTGATKNLQSALRPFGGKLVQVTGDKLTVTERKSGPVGSDNWAQEFQNAANTLASRDKLVKAPLGLLWYGGEAAHARFYFDGNVDHQSGHGLNPQPVSAHVIDGRMILQGPGRLAAVDIYTGRILWETELPKVYTFGGGGGGLGIHSKKHPRPWEHEAALAAEVPVTHRCRASGFNMVSTPDALYLAVDQHIVRVRPTDGEIVARWAVPTALAKGEELCWGGIRESDGVIVATLFRPQDIIDAQAGHDGNGGDWAGDRMPMKHLAALDAATGKLLWSRPATWGYINRSGVCAGAGRVYCVDLVTSKVMNKLQEAGRKMPAEPPRVHALDLKTGKSLWQTDLDVYVQNIAYAAHRDLLLAPCRNLKEWRDGAWVNLSIDQRRGKTNKNAPGRMRALHADNGKVAWEVDESPYHTPIIVLDDLMIDRYGNSFDLPDGTRNERVNPLTGAAERWSFRKGGCNHLIACDNLVTWRCAFYDLAGGSGAMKLAGMDAGCTPTLLPAGGVLNIPNFGTHHKRNRMTALALVHRPGNELWTRFAEKPPEQPAPIRRGGYNFGAPGDRIDESGAVWLAVTPRKRENVTWTLKEEGTWFDGFAEDEAAFVAGSGIAGVQKISLPVTFGGKPKPDGTGRNYKVRLYFSETSHVRPGQRVFSVRLEGKPVLENIDVVNEAGGRFRPIVKEFEVEVTDALDVEFDAKVGQPMLSGVELIAE